MSVITDAIADAIKDNPTNVIGGIATLLGVTLGFVLSTLREWARSRGDVTLVAEKVYTNSYDRSIDYRMYLRAHNSFANAKSIRLNECTAHAIKRSVRLLSVDVSPEVHEEKYALLAPGVFTEVCIKGSIEGNGADAATFWDAVRSVRYFKLTYTISPNKKRYMWAQLTDEQVEVNEKLAREEHRRGKA